MSYKPSVQFRVPLILLVPTWATVNGVRTKTYPAIENGIRFNGSFKTYGGTETTVNGILTIVDTADVETWYMPEIQADCLVVVATNNARYEIISEPENIDMANQFMKFKVRKTKGGA